MRMRYAAVVAGLALGLMSGTAKAAYIIDIEQTATNVVATGSGSIDLSGLHYQETSGQSIGISASQGYVTLGSATNGFGGANYDFYSGVSGPNSFGNGSFKIASSHSGSDVGVYGNFGLGPEILVPQGYLFGDLGVSVDTFANTTLAGLGLTPGSSFEFFNSAQGSEIFPDVVINVGSVSAVPLPASAPMFGAALLALGAVGYGVKRKKAAAAV